MSGAFRSLIAMGRVAAFNLPIAVGRSAFAPSIRTRTSFPLCLRFPSAAYPSTRYSTLAAAPSDPLDASNAPRATLAVDINVPRTDTADEVIVPDVAPAPSPAGMGPAVETFRLSAETIERLKKNGITHVTEVQAGTFDLLYDGSDVIAKSRTGTGKTLAFALPILERLAIIRKEQGPMPRGQGPGCIVLAPTRELAKQVSREMSYIAQGLGLVVDCFYGGTNYNPQEQALSRGLDVLVGTPGRIIDHLNRGTLRLNNVSFAVLDEADEMLSMGFAEDVEEVFQTLPPIEDRQVICFSATVPGWVKNLAAKYQKQDVAMFDSVTSGPMASTTVRHCAVRVPERDEARAALLADIIAVHSRNLPDADHSTGPSRAIVFTQTKREADELASCGALDGCGAAVLHGDVSQRQRESTLAQFRQGRFQVLVATDVAARGLDISGVDVVVQYRVPRDSDAYIHRAGRTGRAGRSGTAVVMYSDREMRSLRDLEFDCRIKFEHESAPAPEMALEAAVDFAIETSRTVDERVLKHLLPRAQQILDSPEDTISLLAGILAVAGRRTALDDRSVLSGENGMRTLHVKGKREISPAITLRFLGDLAREAGEDERVGLIRVCQDGSAVVDVPSATADALLDTAKSSKRIADLTVSVATEVPPLRDDDRRGRGRDRRSRAGGRGDSYSPTRGSYGRGSREGSRYGQRRGRESWSRNDFRRHSYSSRDYSTFRREGDEGYGRRGYSDNGARRQRRVSEFLEDDF